MSAELKIKPFAQLSREELYAILKARVDVFVVEQQCPYPELDGKDLTAVHFFRQDDDGQVLAYLRVFENLDGDMQIGRVLTTVRGKSYGRTLLHAAVRYLEETAPQKQIVLESQTYAVGFYEKEGFAVCSDEFMEDGIPHVKMVRKVSC